MTRGELERRSKWYGQMGEDAHDKPQEGSDAH
jgi:hypothetical protein